MLVAVGLLFCVSRGAAATSCEEVFDVSVHERQLVTQEDKERGRDLEDYTLKILTPGWFSYYQDPRSIGVGGYAKTLLVSAGMKRSKLTFENFLKALGRRQGRPLKWVELGGGLAVSMRQWAMLERKNGRLATQMTNVDAVSWESEGRKSVRQTLKRLNVWYTKELFDSAYRPDHVIADFETARLNFAPDLITSVESIQYAHDKLGAIVNWYNQLADGGILVIASADKWPEWIRNQGNMNGTSTVFDDFYANLRDAGVPIRLSLSQNASRLSETYVVLIEKRPGTKLELKVALKEKWTNPHGFVASYYDNVAAGSQIVKVTSDPK